MDKKLIEDKLSEWLAHPNEFGKKPKEISFKRTYHADLITYGKVDIHLIYYTMPDGYKGRGFVNGNLTWSFLGENLNNISDDDLFIAYCGWAWLFPAINDGNVLTKFHSKSEEKAFLKKKITEGFTNIDIKNRYKIGSSELFEFTAEKNGLLYKGAGDKNNDITLDTLKPKSALPIIYFLIGEEAIKSMS